MKLCFRVSRKILSLWLLNVMTSPHLNSGPVRGQEEAPDAIWVHIPGEPFHFPLRSWEEKAERPGVAQGNPSL